jgi:hypothetical protein
MTFRWCRNFLSAAALRRVGYCSAVATRRRVLPGARAALLSLKSYKERPADTWCARQNFKDSFG